MNKFLCFILFFFFTTLYAFSADMRFIQVDGVLYNTNDKKSISRLENIIDEINKQKNVEFVIFSGNNISKPKKENLENFVKIAKKLDYPFYFVLGNKDVNKQKEFGKKDYFNFLQKKVKTHKKIKSPNYVFIKKDVVFIVVDGSKEVIPTSQGYYKQDVLDWLEIQLSKYYDKNIVILQHFPIIPPAKKENYYTYKADEYLNLVNNHKNIKAIFSGHFNIDKEQVFENILHVSTSNAPQFKIIDIIDYDTKTPTFWTVVK